MNVIEKFIHRLEIAEKIATIEDAEILYKVHYIVEIAIYDRYRLDVEQTINKYPAFNSYRYMAFVAKTKGASIVIRIVSSCRTLVFYHPFSQDELIACLELMKQKFDLEE